MARQCFSKKGKRLCSVSGKVCALSLIGVVWVLFSLKGISISIADEVKRLTSVVKMQEEDISTLQENLQNVSDRCRYMKYVLCSA